VKTISQHSNIRNSSCTRVQTCELRVTWESSNSVMVHCHYSFKKHKSTPISITVKSHKPFSLQESRMLDLVVISCNISHQFSHIDADKVCHHRLWVIMWTRMRKKWLILQKGDVLFVNRLQRTGKRNSVTLKPFIDLDINKKTLTQKTAQFELSIIIEKLEMIFSTDHLILVNLAQIESYLQVQRDSIVLTQ